MIDKDFIQEVIERASEEGVPYNHKFECVYKLIQNFILVHDMENNNEGQALLYAVEKTAERTKREMIEEAGKWLSNNMFNSINNGVIINGYYVSDFIERFKQAMQDESK